MVAFEHLPLTPSKGHVVILHGLEGSASAGYIASFSQEALLRGLTVHRVNMRTCGGTEDLCETMYHSGLTSDTRHIVEEIKQSSSSPIFLVGFSLGGNVVLKLAAELGDTDVLAGVVAISTPIDLARSVRAIDRPSNILYARRFLSRLRGRIRRKSKISPDLYSEEGLDNVRTIWEFDDRFTAPLFGFGTASNYYATQSSSRFLGEIRIPTLVITAEDDPLVPFEMYQHSAFKENPALTLVATERGGHLGFISRKQPRFWLDGLALNWIEHKLRANADGESSGLQAGINQGLPALPGLTHK